MLFELVMQLLSSLFLICPIVQPYFSDGNYYSHWSADAQPVAHATLLCMLADFFVFRALRSIQAERRRDFLFSLLKYGCHCVHGLTFQILIDQ